jgi:hypothetical protein
MSQQAVDAHRLQQLEQLLRQKKEEERLKAREARAIEDELNRARFSASAAALGSDNLHGDYQMSSSSRDHSNMMPRTTTATLSLKAEHPQQQLVRLQHEPCTARPPLTTPLHRTRPAP